MQKGYWPTWFSALIFFVAYYALLVPVPVYLNQIGLPDWEIGLILGAFGVTALICRPLAGIFSDRWGSRPIMLFGAGALTMGAIGMSLTTQPVLLFVCRLLQAAGYAAFTTAATALIATLQTSEKRGSSLAFFGISVNAAMAITPWIITNLISILTLKGTFWLAGFAAVIAGIFAFIALPQTSRFSILTPGRQAIYSIPAQLRIPMIIAALFGIGYGAFLQFVPLLAERREIGSAGVAFTVYGLSIILTRIATGKLLDQRYRHLMLYPAIIILALSLAGFAVGKSQVWILTAAALMALSSGILHPSLIAIHVDRLPETEAGRATGIFYIGFDLGVGTGAWILAPVLQQFGLSSMYLLAALLSGTGIFLLPLLRVQIPKKTLAKPD